MNNPKSDPTSVPQSTRNRTQNAPWQIPLGVTKANWEYAHADHISRGYDEFLTGDPLTAVDRQIIDLYFPDVCNTGSLRSDLDKPIVADFGCGNGRSLMPLLDRGYRGLGIDLSIPMLEGFAKKVSQATTNFGDSLLVQANLVELDGFGDSTVDHGISLFSTLGMIQGSENRAAFLGHARRMIKPGGLFVLHAHNVWFQLRHPGGIRWAISNAISTLRGTTEFGDRTANYRSIQQMFIHSFRRTELERSIRSAGFKQLEWYGILAGQQTATVGRSFGDSLRKVGWIVVCR